MPEPATEPIAAPAAEPIAAPAAESSAASAAGPPSLRASAALVGAGIWFERRCFEVVGALVASTPEPRAKAALSTVSRHHAWRAEQLESVLARTHDLGPDDVVRPVAGFDDEALVALGEAEPTPDRLAALDRLLGAWVDHLTAHRARLSPVADAPLARVLDLVVDDLRRDRAALAGAPGSAP